MPTRSQVSGGAGHHNLPEQRGARGGHQRRGQGYRVRSPDGLSHFRQVFKPGRRFSPLAAPRVADPRSGSMESSSGRGISWSATPTAVCWCPRKSPKRFCSRPKRERRARIRHGPFSSREYPRPKHPNEREGRTCNLGQLRPADSSWRKRSISALPVKTPISSRFFASAQAR